MVTPKYIFSVSNGQLNVVLDNAVPDFDNNESYAYRAASADLYNSKTIKLHDFGLFKKDFNFENIKTIGGAVPTNISNAYTLLLALIPAPL